MAIANGTCVSFCNQPRHNLAHAKSCRYVVAFTRFAGGGIWLRQGSLRHMLGYPGYAPGTIAVNVTWMKRVFNAYQTHRSMYPSVFNRLRAIARYWSEIATFPTPACIYWNSGKKFGLQKTRIMGLTGSEDILTIG